MIPRLARRLIPIAMLLGAAPPAPVAHPALWKVWDADTTIYLLGTIHVLPAGYHWRTPPIDRAIAAASELRLELPENHDADVPTLLVGMGTASGLPPLLDRVTPTKRDGLAAIVARSGMPAGTLDRFKTWAAALLLTGVTLRDLGLDGRSGVEEQITTAFDADHRPVTGFETAAQQLGFFDHLPEADQRRFLESVVDDDKTARKDFADMLASWSAGDEKAISRSFDDDLKDTPTLRDVLLTQRNANWARWIGSRLAQPGTVLVAVGAGHLAGPGSVPAILVSKGYHVSRIE